MQEYEFNVSPEIVAALINGQPGKLLDRARRIADNLADHLGDLGRGGSGRVTGIADGQGPVVSVGRGPEQTTSGQGSPFQGGFFDRPGTGRGGAPGDIRQGGVDFQGGVNRKGPVDNPADLVSDLTTEERIIIARKAFDFTDLSVSAGTNAGDAHRFTQDERDEWARLAQAYWRQAEFYYALGRRRRDNPDADNSAPGLHTQADRSRLWALLSSMGGLVFKEAPASGSSPARVPAILLANDPKPRR